MRRLIVALLLVVCAAVLLRAAQTSPRPAESAASAEAIRLNNLGVATMNQQKFEQALQFFEKAAAADPAFATARVNQAIALLGLQRYEEAGGILETLIAADPQNARAWYNQGLLQKSTGEAEASLASFEKAAALRPADAHTQYFVGLMAAQVQQYETAVAAFTRAIELDPFLVSAEFGLARAYQRAGRGEEAKAHLERFQRLTTEKVASAMSLTYGDQGPLSLAEPVIAAAAAAPAPVRVTFAEAGDDLFRIAAAPPAAAASGDLTGSVGVGGCFFDADGDGHIDYLALNPRVADGKPQDAAVLFRGTGKVSFDRVAQSGFALLFQPVGCAAADFDNDEKPDVAISLLGGGVLLYRNEGGGRFSDVTTATGLPASQAGVAGRSPSTAMGITWIDYDHDGDVDLLVARSPRANGTSGSPAAPGVGGVLVWRNNGNGSFTEVADERGLVGDAAAVAITATDFNNDRAVDLVVTGGASPAVYLNPREGRFTRLEWPAAPLSPSVGAVVLDFNKDGWMDLAFTHAGAPGLSLWKNVEGRSVEAVQLPIVAGSASWGLAAFDYDNDGWIDLVVASETDGQGRLTVLRNEQGRYADASAATGVDGLRLVTPRAVLPADVDGDGDADLVVTSADRAPILIRNEGGNANNVLRLTLKGLNDNRSGIGTKVEVQADSIWQKWETVAASGFLGHGSPDVLAGIGAAKEADVVRLLWPTGVVQDEVQLAAATPQVIEQIDRRGSSCPILFSWNGREYEFITDAIGPGVIGHWVAPGQRNVPDPDEYIKIRGSQLQPRNGRLSLKFAEPMEEVIYLDQVRLFAIDHPQDAEIYPHEYFAALAPQPPAEVFVARGARLPLGAWDEAGRDVLPQLRDLDGQHVDGFGPSPFKGFAALHAVELDLGEVPVDGPVRLLMAGFTDYFTATSVFAAHQADLTPVVPYLEAQRTDGTWQQVIEDIGFPAGLRRTMTADLTGKLPPGTRRVRIWTNLKVYWDQILVDTTPAGAVPHARHEAPLLEASLAFRGFPREHTGTPAADLTYEHAAVSRFGPYARHRGFYTRYGDVRPLVTGIDDRFVIFGAGEEVSLEFDATALPPVRAGWKRDYLFFVHGYVKDMDFYAAHAQTVSPLPFGAMVTYPYPASVRYPDRNRGYLLEWNTRHVDAEAWPSYRFEFRRQH